MIDLFETITPKSPLLTPNRRLAAVFNKKYNAWQMQRSKTSWLSLDILPMTSWIKRLWLETIAREFTPAPFLLSPEAEQIIWETILRKSSHNKSLLQLTSTAELTRAAWGILKQWQVDFTHTELTTTEDSRVFRDWAEEFAKICSENQFLDNPSLTEEVIAKINSGVCVPPEKIILAGFTEITPAHQALLDACENKQTQITIYKPERASNIVQRVSLVDEDTEIHTMARWAKKIYEKDTAATIACVVPNLENLRPRIIEIFSEVFAQDCQYVLDPTVLPFNISAGKSLALYPIIHMALQLLKLPRKNLPLDIISSVVCSPFIGDAETEQFARAQLIAQLQKDNVASLSLANLINHQHMQTCPGLRKCLQVIANSFAEQKKLPLSHWLNSFMATLKAFGWPGERNLNSPEYQTAETWLKLLAGFTQFERIMGPVTYHDALHSLVYLTNAQIYQPESPETNIQILGALEAAEIPFDYLWVMGLDDSNWPQAPRPNPFIPQRLQRSLNMPHATAERELTFTQQLTLQLRQSASNVIFSHACLLEDMPLRPSPIIMDITEISADLLALATFQPPALQVFTARAVEKIQDEIAPPIAADEKPRGGSSIFKNQSACPFKAFAESRLRAKKLEEVTLGLRANQRGVILHKALELIWSELKGQKALLAMSDETLQNLEEKCITQALREEVVNSVNNKNYLKLEATRLQKIIHDWLLLEKFRPDFKVKSLEEKRSAVFANIPINIIVDRIDELADGKQLIIDYKSGKDLSSANWFGERPDEPQLPLYCALEPEQTSGIAFALVRPVKMAWQGISETPLDIKGIKTIADDKEISWAQQINEWRQTLTHLATDFVNGNAQVDPKHGEVTCAHCHLHSLCRINEMVTL